MTVVDLDRAGTAPDDLARFREEFRAWLAGHLPAAWCRQAFPQMIPPGREDPEGVRISRDWQRVLFEGGWAAPGWPTRYGGRGLDLSRRLAVAEELASARAPVPIGYQGIDLLGPTLIEHATEEQKAQFLPGIISGEEIWCQGYSEPGSGSDLASLRTSARRDADRYVLNGQKVWTSFGNRASWCFLLARTGGPDSRHAGISFFVCSMRAPGVEWRPIVELTGTEDFGELFLDDVCIPVDQRIGPEGDGWLVAMSSLGHERLLATNTAHLRARFEALTDLARRRPAGRLDRDRLATLAMRLRALEGLQARALALAMDEDRRFPVWASMVKLSGTELRQDLAQAATALLGIAATVSSHYGAPLDPSDEVAVWAHELLYSRACTIYAGSSEIQRNIIAERGLGLPKDGA